ncbi:MAG TPA: hypothetical protein RMI62_12890, partial [Polyangiaceae bacterium LLY-WYZ-15_(1-7)]|nr:hypothetical protein [Polyangiaceae bacterium LLY-WYZ-15_(1-7)]
ETDAGGVFTHTFAIPRDAEGALQVRATGPRDDARRQVHAQHAATLLAPSEPPLVVQLAPAQGQWLVAPNADVRFDVVVRRADGRPVSNARVRLHRPVPLTAELDQDRRDPWVLTDARGRAQLEWEAPRLRQGWRDVSVTAHAGKAGVGQGSGGARLRVTASRHGARLAVEGGALTPELGGRVFVRVATVDGRPAPAGVPVKLVGPRVGEVEGQTDESGVAALDVSLRDPAEDDRCGGEAATAARVFVAGAQTADSYCLAVDPDAAARVHATPAHPTAGQEIQVEVARTRAARGLPIVLTALRRVGDRLEAVGVAVLEGRQDAATITLPEDAIGEVLLRARPLVGRSLQEARGALTSLYVEPGPGLALEARARGELDAVRADLSATGEPASLLALAVPLGQAGSLEQQTAGLVAGPFGRLPESPTDALYAALLAERTPMDVAAPVVLRGRDLEPQPEPTNPTRLGLLRDPWRASSRFVEGRLALVFRAIEARVDQAVPEELDEVAVEERGRFRFNRQLLASLASGSLGSEGATGLGGEPLTIERLEGLDRAFDYDHVARRITRKRLFKVLLALRSFVQQSALDLAWTRPGDPTLWLERLRNRGVPGLGSLQPRELVDGWGRPFQLRETARARFSRVQPVAGYELVSAGPDGRYGNGDDLVDPTARVLPADSLYAEAVG